MFLQFGLKTLNLTWEKSENVQMRAAKIITGEVVSTNNLKAVREFNLDSLGKKKKIYCVEFLKQG